MKGGFTLQNNRSTECEQLMQNLSESCFYALDLNLYLDTHPDDTDAIALFREACAQAEAYKDTFEQCCYPLRVCSSGKDCEWDWLCGAFPSERI